MSGGSSQSSLTSDVALADVDREQAGRRVFLTFSAGLETLFQQETTDDYKKAANVNWSIGFVLYNAFLISDYFVLTDDFSTSLLCHFALFTPLYIFMFISLKLCHTKYCNLIICLGTGIPFFTELFLLCISHGFNRLYYVSGLAAAPMCLYVLFRPGLRWAIVSVLSQCSVYLGVLCLANIVGDGGKLVTALFSMSGGVITIVTAYAMEGAYRRSFLLNIRVRLLNRELERMAMTDPLMGLGNRRLLDETTARFWAEPSDGMRLASMILIDVDRFKLFNDSYGHAAGDLCLKTIANCVSGLMRNGRDIAVRFGGEEVAVFLPDTDLAEALQVAERIRLAIIDASVPHPALAKDAVVSASLGVATVSVTECTPGDLAIRSDLALYAAKHHGRNQVWPPVPAVGKVEVSPRPGAVPLPCPDGSGVPLRRAS